MSRDIAALLSSLLYAGSVSVSWLETHPNECVRQANPVSKVRHQYLEKIYLDLPSTPSVETLTIDSSKGSARIMVTVRRY
jgi:hypothetical protein